MSNTISSSQSVSNIYQKPAVTTDNSYISKGTRVADTALSNYITQSLSTKAKSADIGTIHSQVPGADHEKDVKDVLQLFNNALEASDDSSNVIFTLPKSSEQVGLICMLIELANESSIADTELSSMFGIISAESTESAAKAQQAQGMAIFTKSILSSSINLAGTANATHKSVKNYSATKTNINQNLANMHEADLQIRQMQNSLNASKNDRLDLADIAASSSTIKKADGSIAELRPQDRALSSENNAIAARNLDETISKRDAFNSAFLQGEARTRLTSSQIEAQRAIGVAGSSIADGTGTLAHNIEQKEETEERSEAKIMDGAVEMSRQQAQKSQQLLSSMMNLLNDTRRNTSDLASSFASNLKA